MIVEKSKRANLQVYGLNEKVFSTYSGVNPAASPDSIALFGEGLSMIRGEENDSMILNVTAELEEII